MENNRNENDLTINLDEELVKTISNDTDMPVMQSVTNDNTTTEFSAGTIDESMLSNNEREMVEQFAEEINIEDVNQIVNYGLKAQTNISEFSTSMLKKVKTYDLGEIGDSLKELTLTLDETANPEKKGVINHIFHKAKKSVNSIRAGYAKAESNVDRIEKDLLTHRTVLIQDIALYQEMYELNVQYYKELTLYIIAGKKALAMAKDGKLRELKKIAEAGNKQEDVQAYKDYEDLCNRFEKKLSDLEITRVISMQSAPQVRMLQNNDREMLDKLQSSLSNTIPLWRNQLVLSLGIEHTSRALDAQEALADKTNELLRKNSETLKMATIDTAKQSERPLVDITTLQQCNKDLISSITEVVKIHEQGAVKREKMQEELVKIEADLKKAMMTTEE